MMDLSFFELLMMCAAGALLFFTVRQEIMWYVDEQIDASLQRFLPCTKDMSFNPRYWLRWSTSAWTKYAQRAQIRYALFG